MSTRPKHIYVHELRFEGMQKLMPRERESLERAIAVAFAEIDARNIRAHWSVRFECANSHARGSL